MPFSQIIPPSLSPTESKRLFYTSVSLLLSHLQGYHYHLSKFHIYELVYSLERLWCWQGLGARGEGDGRGSDGWMASLTQWTWVWVNYRSWWWTGKPGMLRFMASQRVVHDWATDLILYWCFPFWLTSVCIIGSNFIHLIRIDSNIFFLMAEVRKQQLELDMEQQTGSK